MTSNVSRDPHSISYLIRSGIAGGVAGCVAKTAVAPLDRVKILFQASNPDFQKYAGTWTGAFRAGRKIFRNSGIRGLFQGHSATIFRIFPYAGIKFMAYDQVRHVLMPSRKDETNVRRFVAGATSGLVAVIFTYPLEMLRVRMAFETRSHTNPTSQLQSPAFSRAFWQIYGENALASGSKTSSPPALFIRFPLLKFYRGFTVTMIGMVPYAGVSFLTWDYLHAHFRLHPSATSNPRKMVFTDLTIGAVSGALAQTASYPFEIIRRRMQVGGITSPDRWLRWGETAKAVWHTGGWRGFYVGLGIGYLKVVPMTALSFAVWQCGKRVLGL